MNATLPERRQGGDAPSPQTPSRGKKADPLALGVAFKTVIVGVDLTLHVPESVLGEFLNYANSIKGSPPFVSGWAHEPIIQALIVGIPNKGDHGWDRPINQRLNGPSIRGRIKRIRAISRREPLLATTIQIHEIFWQKIVERAAFYGITPGELCLSCVEYFARLQREYQARQKPRTPFAAFERSLAKEARQKPRESRPVVAREVVPENVLQFVR